MFEFNALKVITMAWLSLRCYSGKVNSSERFYRRSLPNSETNQSHFCAAYSFSCIYIYCSLYILQHVQYGGLVGVGNKFGDIRPYLNFLCNIVHSVHSQIIKKIFIYSFCLKQVIDSGLSLYAPQCHNYEVLYNNT